MRVEIDFDKYVWKKGEWEDSGNGVALIGLETDGASDKKEYSLTFEIDGNSYYYNLLDIENLMEFLTK